MQKQNLFVLTFGLSVSVTGGTVLARTVEKTQGLVSPPTEQGVIRTERQKVLELVDYKRKTS